MATVQCDHALDVENQEQEIHIRDAVAQGQYICQHCREPMIPKAQRSSVVEPHFAHKVTNTERPCQYSSESYRHNKAKQLLVARLRVMVPAVYALAPEGYTGPVPRLAKAQEVKAVRAERERNIYVNENAELIIEPRTSGQPFDDQQGRRRWLARPDVIFYDAADHPILLIEIHAEHKCGPDKIARLHQYGVDTIEISIPRHFDAAAIDDLFDVTRNTQWLYNGQRAAYNFDPSDSPLPGAGSIPATDLPGGISDRSESVKCRLNRVEGALFAVGAVLARPDVAAQNQAYQRAEAKGQEFTAGLEKARRERDQRLSEHARTRIARYRGELERRGSTLAEDEKVLRGKQRELSEAEAELGKLIRRRKDQLARIVEYAKARAHRISKQLDWEHFLLTSRLGDDQHELNRLQEQFRAREHVALCREEERLGELEQQLSEEEQRLADEEASVGVAEAATSRSAARRAADLGTFNRYYQELQELKSRAGSPGTVAG